MRCSTGIPRGVHKFQKRKCGVRTIGALISGVSIVIAGKWGLYQRALAVVRSKYRRDRR